MSDKTNWTDELTDEQKTFVVDLVITTVKEIREQIGTRLFAK